MGERLQVCDVSASTSNGTHLPKYTIDADYSNESYWAGRGLGARLIFDLCGLYEIQSIALTWLYGNRRMYTFEIEVSQDSINWTKVFDGNSSGKSTDSEVVSIDPTVARYVRYVGNGNSSDSWNYVIECDIFGDVKTQLNKTKSSQVSIFPNPSSHNLQIKIDSDTPMDIRIYNVQGSLVFEKHNASNRIFISKEMGFKSGVYFIILENALNQRITDRFTIL